MVFDAEHFDGYKANSQYAMKTLEAAAEAGRIGWYSAIPTGAKFSLEITEITEQVLKKYTIPIGIHCHNDGGMAVANSIMAVEQGAVQVQGTFNGYGERCGNADLSVIIPNLQIKRGKSCIREEGLRELSSACRYISELANLPHNERQPYVGNCAFAHKGGMHIDGL